MKYKPEDFKYAIVKILKNEKYIAQPIAEWMAKWANAQCEDCDECHADCDSCTRVDPEDYCPEPQYDEGRM